MSGYHLGSYSRSKYSRAPAGGDGATAYDTVDDMIGAQSGAASGALGKLSGVSGSVCEIVTEAWVPHPLFCGVAIPALSLGKDTNGYQDQQGASTVSGSGIVLTGSDAVAEEVRTYGHGSAGYWDYGQKITLALPALGDGLFVGVRAVFRVAVSDRNNGNDMAVLVGLYDPDDPDTGVMTRLWYNNTSWSSSVGSVNAGTFANSNATSNNISAATLDGAGADVTLDLMCLNYGRDVRGWADIDDGTEVEDLSQTLAGSHPFVSLLEESNPEIGCWIGAVVEDGGDPSTFTATLKSIRFWGL